LIPRSGNSRVVLLRVDQALLRRDRAAQAGAIAAQ